MDSFLNSMTFASSEFTESIGGCDCDECGIVGSENSKIPGPILSAMREHKRQKIMNGPIKRTQIRKLICRRGPPSNIAVWNWILPLEAEPLIEYGSTHRIIWIEKLPSKLKSIGHGGIIGSSNEEKTRIVLKDWIEGGIYFIPSNGGKAIGFIHTTAASAENTTAGSSSTIDINSATASNTTAGNEDPTKTTTTTTTPSEEETNEEAHNEDEKKNMEESSKVSSAPTEGEGAVVVSTSSVETQQQPSNSSSTGHAIMWQVKIPTSLVGSSSTSTINPATMEGWIFMLITLCQNLLNKKKNNSNDDNDATSATTKSSSTTTKFEYYEFPNDCHAIIRRAIQEAQESSSSSSAGYGNRTPTTTAGMPSSSSSSSMEVHNNNHHQNQPPA